jgi:hypothetical protein
MPTVQAINVKFVDSYDRSVTNLQPYSNVISQTFTFQHKLENANVSFKMMAIDNNDAYNNGTERTGWRTGLRLFDANGILIYNLGIFYDSRRSDSILLKPYKTYKLEVKTQYPDLNFSGNYKIRIQMILHDNDKEPTPMFEENAFFSINLKTVPDPNPKPKTVDEDALPEPDEHKELDLNKLVPVIVLILITLVLVIIWYKRNKK